MFIVPNKQSSDVFKLTEGEDEQARDIGSDVAIARYKMDIGERNNIGAMITSRRGDDYNNTLASVDGSYWLSKEDNINYQLAYAESDNPWQLQHKDDNDDDIQLSPTQSDHALSLGYSHNTRDYNLKASYQNIGQDFRADLGFMSQVGYEKLALAAVNAGTANKERPLIAGVTLAIGIKPMVKMVKC